MILPRLVPILSLSVLAACSSTDVIAPSTPDGFAAAHFDQLLGSACSAGSNARCQFLAAFALPPAFGAASSPVSIDTGTASLAWQAFVFDVVDSSTSTHAITESLTIMAFGDTNVSDGLLFTTNSGAIYLSDTVNAAEAVATNSGWNAGSAQGSCATPPTLHHTSVPTLDGASCTVQTFSINFQFQFTQPTFTVTLAPTNVNGIRIVRTN
jgi:hypothetical protein